MTRPLHIFVVLWISVLGLTMARAERFTIPNQPLQISNTGFILAPSSLSHPNEFGRIIDNGAVKYLSNILLSRGEPISGRGQDGVFRKIRLNPETGELQNADGTALNHPETIADFKDYFIALNMTQNSSIQKFMIKYFSGSQEGPNSSNSSQSPTDNSNHAGGNSQSSNQPHPETDSSSAKRNTESNEPLPSETNAPSQNTNEQTSNESGQKTPALDTNKFNKRFQLSTISTEAANRPFINGKKTVEASECGASLVSRVQTQEKGADNTPLCKVAFFTAGHCIPTQSEISISGNPSEVALDSFKLKTPSGVNIEGRAEKVEVVLSKNFNGRRRFVRNANRQIVIADITSVKDDYAMLFFKVACSAVKENEVTPFSSSPLRVGDPLSAITQDNQESLMSVQGRDRNDSGKISSGLQRLGSVRPGDSGGPVFNRFGQLVGAISHVTFNQGADISTANGMTFEADGIRWAQALIKERHGVPASAEQNIASGPSGQKQLNPERDTASATPPQQKRDRTSEVQAPPFKEIAARTQDLKNVMEQAKKAGYKNIIIRYGNDTSCGNCRELRGQLQAQFAQEKGVLVIKVEDLTPIAGQGIPQSELRSLDETGQWKRIGKFRIGSGAAADHFKEQISNLSRERISENNNTNPDPQNPAESQITESSIPGFDQLTADRIGSAASKSLFGKDSQGNFVPVFIDQRTGRPVTQDRNVLDLPESTLKQLNDYYVKNRNKLSAPEQKIADRYMNYYESSHQPSSSTTPTEPQPPVSNENNTFANEGSQERDFECVQSNGGFRPQHKTAKIPLGASVMRTQQECLLAVKASRNGLACSATGRGFKPTYLRGVTQSRSDYGYVGGSSMSLQDCLFATERSTSTHICYWGGSSWYATHPTGDNSLKGGPFNSVQACVNSYGGRERIASQSPTRPASNPPPVKPDRGGPIRDLIGNIRDRFIPRREPSQAQATPSAARGHELLGGNCFSCHRPNGQASEFPRWLAQQGEFERRLASTNPQEKFEAQEWIGKLNQVLNLDESMPPKSSVEKRDAFFRNPEAAKFKAWIAQQNSRLNRSVQSQNATQPRHEDSKLDSEVSTAQQPRPQATPAKNAVQLLPQNKLNFYRSILPAVENKELDAILRDPNTLFFDQQSMVAGYQDPSSPVIGIRSTEPGFRGASFGAGADQLYLNSQGHLRMFSKGVGLQGASNMETFHFIHLPKDANGNLQKIRVVERIKPPDETPVFDWVFPVGTVSGEVVYNVDSSGKPQVLEVRTRTKDKPQGAWAPDIQRPFPTAGALSERLSEVAESQPQLKAEAEKLLSHLNNKSRLVPLQIKRDGFQKGNFESSGGTDVLPDMSEAMVKALLATPFRSSLGTEWDNNGRVTAFAPTSNQPNGIVPQHARSGGIRVDRESCNKCHEDSNRPIRDFFDRNHPSFNSSIFAYGNLPGSDRNLRFTIFDQRYFSQFGRTGSGDNRVIRQELMPILEFQR